MIDNKVHEILKTLKTRRKKRKEKVQENIANYRRPLPCFDSGPCDLCFPAEDYDNCRESIRNLQANTIFPKRLPYTLPCLQPDDDLEFVGTYPPGGIYVQPKSKCPCPLPFQGATPPNPPEYCPAWPPWTPKWEEAIFSQQSSNEGLPCGIR